MTKTVEAVQVQADSTMTIRECPNCGGLHEDLPVRQFNKPYGPYTHFFQCPTTGDPGFLSLHIFDGQTLVEVNATLCRNIVTAQESGSFMAVFFRVENGEIILDRTTKNFPKGDFDRCLDLLKRNLADESGPPAPQPMKTAPAGQAPLLNLFGNDKQDVQAQMVEAMQQTAQEATPSLPPATPAISSEPAASGEQAAADAANEPNVVWQQASPPAAQSRPQDVEPV